MTIRYRLDNGLTVLFEPQHTAHVAAFQVWVRVGSADERPDQAGLAHLHEHMLFKGTARRGPGEIARDIEAHGGEINAWTSFDQTVYHVVLASQFARTGLDILADAVRASAFDPEELGREIEVVREEIKRSADQPSRRASRDLFSTAFAVHPYRHPVIGTDESVRSFTRQKVLEFYRTHYTPANMVLVAAGDLSEATLREWVEELFGGSWGEPYRACGPRPAEPARTGRTVHLKEDEAKEVHLHLAFQIPDFLHPDTPALDVFAMWMGQGESSRLSLEVKRRAELVNDVHASAYTPRDPGLFTVSLTCPPAKLERAVEETVRVLAQAKLQAPPEDELRTIQTLIESEHVYQRETVQGLARKLGYYESGGGGLEQEARYQAAVAALGPGDIRVIAERYLRFDRLVAAGLVPRGVTLSPGALEAAIDRGIKAAAPAPASTPEPSPHAPSLGPRPRAGGRREVEQVLPSGARIIVREEPDVPLFAMRAVFLGGLRAETEADNGISTLVARTLTRGTRTRDAEAILRLGDELSGGVSASAGRNSVTVRGEFLSKHFERGFELFAELLTEPTFPEAEVARERALLLQDIHTREDRPSQVAFDLFSRTLWERHPYRLPVQGTEAAVQGLFAAALRDYHARLMTPGALTLAVVGDVDADQVLELCAERFGRAGSPPARWEVPDEPPPALAKIAHRPLQRAQSHLVFGVRGLRVDSPRRRALDVLSTVLSGQGGRLFVELRDKKSLAYSVSSYAIEGVDPGFFAVYIGTSPEKQDEAVAGIRSELGRLCEEPISKAELLRAQRHMVGTHEIGLQRNGSRAAALALDAAYGLPSGSLERYAAEAFAVTAADVQAVARELLTLERATLVVVGPRAP